MKGNRRRGRQKKRWEDNIKERRGMDFTRSTRADENKTRWKYVAYSSVVPRRPSKVMGYNRIEKNVNKYESYRKLSAHDWTDVRRMYRQTRVGSQRENILPHYLRVEHYPWMLFIYLSVRRMRCSNPGPPDRQVRA